MGCLEIEKKLLGKKLKADKIKEFNMIPKKRKKIKKFSSSLDIFDENNKEISIDETDDKQNENRPITISNNIVNKIKILNDVSEDDDFSYELLNGIYSLEVKKGDKKEDFLILNLKNNGESVWPDDSSFLIYQSKTCPEVFINNIKLGKMKKSEIGKCKIIFRNLDNCNVGNYSIVYNVIIKGKIIGNPILLYLNIIE